MDAADRLDQLLSSPIARDTCPSADELAAYSLRALDAASDLRVAAHVRGCPACLLEVTLVSEETPRPRPRTILALLQAPLLQTALRGNPDTDHVAYSAGGFLIHLTIVLKSDDRYRLTGQILRDGVGAPDWSVHVTATGRRYRQSTSDAGMFTVEGLYPGRCLITLSDGVTRIQIRDLTIGEAP